MIQLGFVTRLYALARFFVTFLAAGALFPALRALELAAAFRSGFFAPLEAGLAAFGATLAGFPGLLAPLPGILAARPAALLMAFAIGLAEPVFPGALVSRAPIADRIRLISRVTCSMVIMPSTVASLRRSE